MAFSILLVIIVLATGCVALKWRRISTTLYILSISLFLAVGCGPIPTWLLGNLQSDYSIKPTIEWGTRNAIVLLGSGTQRIPHTDFVEPGIFSYARILTAAELYNDCKKTSAECKVIVSGGDPKKTGSPEAVVYGNSLLKLRIDKADLLLEPNSMNTWRNAEFTSTLLERYGANRVLLVSSGFHLRRSVLYFTHFAVTATPVRADYLRGIMSVRPLSHNFAVADLALHEYTGIARYHIYNALGWNSERKKPVQENITW